MSGRSSGLARSMRLASRQRRFVRLREGHQALTSSSSWSTTFPVRVLRKLNRPVSATSASLGRLKGKALGAPAFRRPGAALIRTLPDARLSRARGGAPARWQGRDCDGKDARSVPPADGLARLGRGRLQVGDDEAAGGTGSEGAVDSGSDRAWVAADPARRAGSFPGGRARLAGPDRRGAAQGGGRLRSLVPAVGPRERV